MLQQNIVKRRTAKASKRMTKEIRPYPYACVPPSDPPMVNLQPKRQINLPLTIETGTPGTVELKEIETALALQTGISADKLFWLVEDLMVWLEPGPHSLTLTHPDTGITSSDSGDYTRRAACGLKFPKNIQVLQHNPVASTLFTVTTSSSTGLMDGRTHITYWSA